MADELDLVNRYVGERTARTMAEFIEVITGNSTDEDVTERADLFKTFLGNYEVHTNENKPGAFPGFPTTQEIVVAAEALYAKLKEYSDQGMLTASGEPIRAEILAEDFRIVAGYIENMEKVLVDLGKYEADPAVERDPEMLSQAEMAEHFKFLFVGDITSILKDLESGYDRETEKREELAREKFPELSKLLMMTLGLDDIETSTGSLNIGFTIYGFTGAKLKRAYAELKANVDSTSLPEEVRSFSSQLREIHIAIEDFLPSGNPEAAFQDIKAAVTQATAVIPALIQIRDGYVGGGLALEESLAPQKFNQGSGEFEALSDAELKGRIQKDINGMIGVLGSIEKAQDIDTYQRRRGSAEVS